MKVIVIVICAILFSCESQSAVEKSRPETLSEKIAQSQKLYESLGSIDNYANLRLAAKAHSINEDKLISAYFMYLTRHDMLYLVKELNPQFDVLKSDNGLDETLNLIQQKYGIKSNDFAKVIIDMKSLEARQD